MLLISLTLTITFSSFILNRRTFPGEVSGLESISLSMGKGAGEESSQVMYPQVTQLGCATSPRFSHLVVLSPLGHRRPLCLTSNLGLGVGQAYLSLGSSPKVDLTELHSLLQCSLFIHLSKEMTKVRRPECWASSQPCASGSTYQPMGRSPVL